jgi:Low-density lipoprotein receptor repeat class B
MPINIILKFASFTIFLLFATYPVLAQQQLFWSDSQIVSQVSLTTIYAANINGSNNQVILNLGQNGQVNSLVVDDVNKKILWADSRRDAISRANFDGTAYEPNFIGKLVNPSSVAVDLVNSRIFWTEDTGVGVAQLDGSSPQLIILEQFWPYSSISVDPIRGYLFYLETINGSLGAIHRVELSNFAKNVVINSLFGGPALISESFSGRLFFANFENAGISRTSYNSNDTIFQYVPLSSPGAIRQIAFDYPTTALYFSDVIAQAIIRSPFSNPTQLSAIVGNKNPPSGLAISCGQFAPDNDKDGLSDCRDACPSDATKTVSPGVCGCGVVDTDSDGDGIADCIDNCSSDKNKLNPGVCGCGVPDVDTDSDGILDCQDQCPQDIFKFAPGVCGCGQSDSNPTDSDLDGVINCLDQCPDDSRKTAQGTCGCGKVEQFNSANVLSCVTFRTLAPSTQLTKPPTVIVSGRDVKIIFEKFAGATLRKVKQTADFEYVIDVSYVMSYARAKKTKLTVRYKVVLQNTAAGKRDAKAATTKRNEYAFKNLKPGNYTAKYRAEILKNGKAVSRTKYSPSASFTVN